MAYVQHSDVHVSITALLDLIASEPDPAVRLVLLHRSLRDVRRDLSIARNETAWLARQAYSTVDLERATGVNHGTISDWVKAHIARTGAARPLSRRRIDLSLAHDLTRLPEDRQRALGVGTVEAPAAG
jgi:hypothetical protein